MTRRLGYAGTALGALLLPACMSLSQPDPNASNTVVIDRTHLAPRVSNNGVARTPDHRFAEQRSVVSTEPPPATNPTTVPTTPKNPVVPTRFGEIPKSPDLAKVAPGTLRIQDPKTEAKPQDKPNVPSAIIAVQATQPVPTGPIGNKPGELRPSPEVTDDPIKAPPFPMLVPPSESTPASVEIPIGIPESTPPSGTTPAPVINPVPGISATPGANIAPGISAAPMMGIPTVSEPLIIGQSHLNMQPIMAPGMIPSSVVVPPVAEPTPAVISPVADNPLPSSGARLPSLPQASTTAVPPNLGTPTTPGPVAIPPVPVGPPETNNVVVPPAPVSMKPAMGEALPAPIMHQTAMSSPATGESNLVRAVQAFQANRPDEAIKLLGAYDSTNQQVLLYLMPTLVQLSEGALAKMTPEQLAVMIDRLQGASGMLKSKAALQLGTVCFCREVRKFADVVPFSQNHVYKPGEMLHLYAELKNIICEPTTQAGEPGFAIRLGSSLELRDSAGTVVWRVDPAEKVDFARTCPQDYYRAYRFCVPANLPAGLYHLNLTILDKTSQREVRRSMELPVGRN